MLYAEKKTERYTQNGTATGHKREKLQDRYNRAKRTIARGQETMIPV